MEWQHIAQDGRRGDGCGSMDSGNCSGEEKRRSKVFLANPGRKSLKIP